MGVIKTVRQSKPNSFDYTPGMFFATISNHILFQRKYKDIDSESDISKEQKTKQ